MFRRIVPFLAALAAALHAASFVGSGPCDDDYITYRYARNLVEGLGPVYNAGERVEGFSAPGWMLAVAGALKLGVDPARFSVVLSIAAFAVTAFAVANLWLRREREDRFAAPAWLVAASPAIAWHAIVGLGTVIVAALLAVWLDRWHKALRQERSALGAGVALGLAAFVRNEAVLFALPFAFVELRRRSWSSVLAAFAPLVAWELFRVAYYGRVVPITYTVKKLAFLDDVRLGLEYLASASASSGLIVGLALAIVVLARRRDAADVALRAAAIGCLAFVAYVVYVGGDFLPLARFFVPALPLIALLACAGFVESFGGKRWLAVTAFLAALAWLQLEQQRRPELFEVHRGSEARWEAMGREVAARVSATTKVALAPIGAFGWTSRLYVVDLLGLTNTAIAQAPPDPEITIKGHTRYDAEWTLAQAPEMIILGNGWVHEEPDGQRTLVANPWEKTLIAHPRFQSDYVPLKIDIAGSYPLIFYWRRDVPRPAGAREV